MAYGRSTTSSISDAFTLNPLPYPVLAILAVISIFLGISWYFSYESVVETAEWDMGWILLATPVVLILLVKFLSSMDNQSFFTGWGRRRAINSQPSEGSSPWGVAALIVILLVLLQYQSSFLDSWF
ncbi:hypothetical protein BT93_I0648 [Corymbia citriodora subsp. variegata]|nr:hypothetical protein BT93_I0648 [Corymbia citriodora subsp. variegata]